MIDQDLKDWMDQYMIRRKKEDVLPSLQTLNVALRTKKIFHYNLNLSEYEKQLISTHRKDLLFLVEHGNAQISRMNVIMRMRQLCVSEILTKKSGQEWINKMHANMLKANMNCPLTNDADYEMAFTILSRSTKLKTVVSDSKF